MPSTYSPSLKIELIAVGEQTDAWGTTTNDNFENVFEEAITGMATAIFPADADYDWATGYVNSVGSQAQRNLVIEVQGTLSLTRNLIVPTIEKQYLIHNNTIGGQSIVVKTLAGTGITIPNGQRAHLYVNGTDVIAVVNYFPTIRAGSATLDTALPVTSGGTGSTSLATITVGAATNIAGGAANRIPYNTGAGVTSFVVAPTSPNTLLEWDGSAFVWSALPATVGSFSAGTTGLTPNTPTTGAVVLGGVLNLANGGTGQTSAQGAMNALAGAVTSGQYLRGNGTNVVMSAIQAADVPTLNQNTTGTASNVTGVVAIANGGTGQTTANAALNALLPTQTGNAGEYLTTDGTNTSWAAVPVGTTFSAGTTGFTPNTATSGAVTLAGTLNIANGGSGQTTAQAAMNAFAGAVTSGSYLRGNGTNVVMSAIQAADVPTLNQNTTGSAAALSGGAANRIPYNTASATTAFIVAPTVSSTYLQWTGSAFAWASVSTGGVTSFSAGTTGLTPNSATTGAVTLAGTLAVANGGTGQTSLASVSVGSATTATNVAGGGANRIPYNTGAGTTSFVTAPTVASTYLQWDGTAFAWASVTGGVSSFSAGTTGLTPSTSTTGAVTLAGTLGTANGGSGQTNLTYPTGPVTLVGTSSTQTLTNKTIEKRIFSTTSYASPLAWNSNSYDIYVATNQSNNLTINADAGSPTNGQTMIFRFTVSSATYTLTWATGVSKGFRAIGVTLPTNPSPSKTVYVGCIFNSLADRWDVLAVSQEV